MKDVRRLKRLPIVKIPVKKVSRFNQHKGMFTCKRVLKYEGLNFSLSDPLEQSVAAEDKLFFKRQGPQMKVIKKLIQGEIARSAYLDLHGMTVEQAREQASRYAHEKFWPSCPQN